MSVSGVFTRRRVWIGIIAVALLGLWWAWTTWAVPDGDERTVAYDAACADAARLHSAGLLDEAREAYVRISDAEPQPDCASERVLVEGDDQASAAAAERGAVYFSAAQLKRGGAREVVLSRARNAYIGALSLDPYAADARRELGGLIAAMGVPMTTDAANARCAFADRLRNARMFELARRAYATALRTSRTTACVRYGLRVLRQDTATAEQIVRRARALDKADRPEEARPRYIAAVAWNPMAVGAREALDRIDGPDPRDGTTSGHLRNVADSVGVGVGDVRSAATWVKDNSEAFALVAAAVILVLPILMWLLYWVTVKPRGRGVVRRVYLPRFARTQLTVTTFIPEDKAATSRALFADWLGQRPANPDAEAGETVGDTIKGDALVTDIWEAPAVPPADPVDALFAGTAASGMVAAALRLAQRVTPNREVRFSGELLDGSVHGPGLRIVANRRFRPPQHHIWWAADLPSAPVEDEAASDAREALAIVAATWAHEQFAE
jgi:hypothetical protein